MTEDQEPPWHLIDDYLARASRYDESPHDHRERILDTIEELVDSSLDSRNTPALVMAADQLSDAIFVYLFAHRNRNDLRNRIPEHLLNFADKARDHVEDGGVFHLDHALQIDPTPFLGAKPKGSGEHKHQRLFLMTFHDHEVHKIFPTQIGSLRNAAHIAGLNAYEEKNLDGEYRTWRDANIEWLVWLFDLVDARPFDTLE